MFNNLILLFADACDKSGGFLGLVPWYHYITLSSGCEVRDFNLLPSGGQPSDVPLVLLALVDDLLRIAGILAVGFVIYGGIQFIGSQGNPEQTSKARSTIINALLGLALAMVAVAFVSYLGNRLGG